MGHRRQHAAFFLERFERCRVGNVPNGLEGYISPDDGVVGAVNHSHATLAENLFDLVTTLQLRLGCHRECPSMEVCSVTVQ